MKGYRKLKVGEMIMNGDVFFNSSKVIRQAVCLGVVYDNSKFRNHYRPLPAKKGHKWTWTKAGDKGAYLRCGTELKGVIYSMKDTRLLVRAVNRELGA